MTDEFAIKILEQYREKPTLINEIETIEEAVWLDEALDVAIKALEQEPKWILCNEKLIHEYISKVECCDACFASVFCTWNGLRESRVPQDYCIENIKKYFEDKVSLTGAESEDKE